MNDEKQFPPRMLITAASMKYIMASDTEYLSVAERDAERAELLGKLVKIEDLANRIRKNPTVTIEVKQILDLLGEITAGLGK